MQMSWSTFKDVLSRGSQMSHLERALCLLWYYGHEDGFEGKSASSLATDIHNLSIGNPNKTSLRSALTKSKLTITRSGAFIIRQDRRDEVFALLKNYMGGMAPIPVEQERGFLPKAVWSGTKKHIERVCEQINGCFQHGFYDAAHVMLRRLVETLLIEAYAKLGREGDIQKSGEYMMLGDIVNKATDGKGLPLGRDAKNGAKAIKKLGDRSAHNRYFIACKADLEKVEQDVRVVIDELIAIAALRSN